MKDMKIIKVAGVLLVVLLVFSLTTALAAAAPDYTPQAEALKQLGLFMGTANGFELERTATRAESAVMTVRLLGKEAEAKQSNFAHPFADVPEWAAAYVGYLYHNNITAGVGDNLFGSSQTATSAQYATFILRALGYDDSAGDFSWDASLNKMVSLGIITGAQAADFSGGTGALRGDVAAISYFSLFANLKGGSETLIEKLYTADDAISAWQLRDAAAIDGRLSMFSNIFGISKPYPQGEPLNSEEIYAKTSDAVFKIETKILSDADFGSGSGFFITSDGIAITNIHVISLMSSANITTTDGASYPIEGILALHTAADLAVIKVKGSGFSYLEIGDPSLLRTAQRIYCVGSPYGLDDTISDGLVSNLKREYEDYTYIQISAPIAPGSSGGALLNEYGQVVGITTAGFDEGNVNLAVPISELATVRRYPALRSVKYLQAHSRFGLTPRGKVYYESGSNDDKSAQSMENDAVMYGTISGVDDVDRYTLNVKEKAEMFISLTSSEPYADGLRFEVRDPSGTVILNSRHYGGEMFSLAEGLGAAKGSYTIKIYVEDNGEDWSDVNYELFWFYYDANRNLKMKDWDWGFFLEFEPNDSPEYANYLPDGFHCLATISTKNDEDYYTFTLTERQNYVANIVTFNEKSVLTAEVFNADNKSVGRFRYSDGIEIFDETLPAGVYYIKVSVKDTKMKWDNEVYYIKAGVFR
jgi:S1-C subfamily serine protease